MTTAELNDLIEAARDYAKAKRREEQALELLQQTACRNGVTIRGTNPEEDAAAAIGQQLLDDTQTQVTYKEYED